ncbi:MAG: hypothetical protein ACI4WH_07295 [Oscillospiraceae bacterium]
MNSIEDNIYRAYNIGASKSVYIQEDFTNKVKQELNKNYTLSITNHPFKQQQDGTFRRNYDANILTLDDIKNGIPVEVYVDKKCNIIKAIIRVSNMSDEYDWCVAILFDNDNSKFIVKTIYLNDKIDNHISLAKNYCVKPFNFKCKQCPEKTRMNCIWRDCIIK